MWPYIQISKGGHHIIIYKGESHIPNHKIYGPNIHSLKMSHMITITKDGVTLSIL